MNSFKFGNTDSVISSTFQVVYNVHDCIDQSYSNSRQFSISGFYNSKGQTGALFVEQKQHLKSRVT